MLSSLPDIEKEISLNLPSKVHPLILPQSLDKHINIFVKRDDLIHPVVSGNKWRKLKYNVAAFYNRKSNGIISFGGAYSNHLYALSHVCCKLKIPFVAIVRGDKYDDQNTTLKALKANGTEMHFVSRTAYREKENSIEIQKVISRYDNFLLIPEGGSNAEAQLGLKEFCQEIDWSSYEHIFVSAGTGATASALIKFIIEENLSNQLHVVSALKGGFMRSAIDDIIGCMTDERLHVYDDYHFGGYAKMPKELIDFANGINLLTEMEMDLVYNAKTFYAIMDLIKSGEFNAGANILFINTGGKRS